MGSIGRARKASTSKTEGVKSTLHLGDGYWTERVYIASGSTEAVDHEVSNQESLKCLAKPSRTENEQSMQELFKKCQQISLKTAKVQIETGAGTELGWVGSDKGVLPVDALNEKKANDRKHLLELCGQRIAVILERDKAVEANSRLEEEKERLCRTVEELNAELDALKVENTMLQESAERTAASTALLETRLVELESRYVESEKAVLEERRRLATASMERDEARRQGEEALQANFVLQQENDELRASVERLSVVPRATVDDDSDAPLLQASTETVGPSPSVTTVQASVSNLSLADSASHCFELNACSLLRNRPWTRVLPFVKCWRTLFTDRCVSGCIHNDFPNETDISLARTRLPGRAGLCHRSSRGRRKRASKRFWDVGPGWPL